MKKFFLSLLVSYPVMAFAHDALHSQQNKFSLSSIQSIVRTALLKADAQIDFLTLSMDLPAIAELYFQSYLENMQAPNSTTPTPVNLVEAYKTELVIATVLKELKTAYPYLINDQSKWMVNNVGGIFINMIILYCSPREYLVLWGTALPAKNKFSGYFPFMNESDVMVRGEMTLQDFGHAGNVAMLFQPYIQDSVYATTADTANLTRGKMRSYNLKSYTYLISYAHGSITRAFISGQILPGIFDHPNWASSWAHIKESIKAYRHSKKKPEKKSYIDYQQEFKKNPNYRAWWIIDIFRSQNPDGVDDRDFY